MALSAEVRDIGSNHLRLRHEYTFTVPDVLSEDIVLSFPLSGWLSVHPLADCRMKLLVADLMNDSIRQNIARHSLIIDNKGIPKLPGFVEHLQSTWRNVEFVHLPPSGYRSEEAASYVSARANRWAYNLAPAGGTPLGNGHRTYQPASWF